MTEAPRWTITDAHVDHAIAAVAGAAVRTPLVHAPAIGPRVHLKRETAQHTGSFKVRGALARLSALDASERARGVIASSAGNHGLGVAFAASRLGVRARVYVPQHTPRIKRDGMVRLGAEVVVTGAPGYDATERIARAAAAREGAVFVSPYDDPFVAAGNGATIGLEIWSELPGATVVAPVGGGGLVTGLGAARRRLGSRARVVGVQSEASPAMARSFEEGRALEVFEGGRTLAEGLEGGVSATAYHHVRAILDRVELVTEAAIADAMRFAEASLGEIVEGSAAVVVAWAREHAAVAPGSEPLVLVLTGRNVD